jgi:hypothetical protein
VLVYSKVTAKGTAMPRRELLAEALWINVQDEMG